MNHSTLSVETADHVDVASLADRTVLVSLTRRGAPLADLRLSLDEVDKLVHILRQHSAIAGAVPAVCSPRTLVASRAIH